MIFPKECLTITYILNNLKFTSKLNLFDYFYHINVLNISILNNYYFTHLYIHYFVIM